MDDTDHPLFPRLSAELVAIRSARRRSFVLVTGLAAADAGVAKRQSHVRK